MEHYAKKDAGKPFPYPSVVNPDAPITLVTEDLPDRGCHFYDQYEDYIADMKQTGQNTFRLSLAWPRIIPTGYGAVHAISPVYPAQVNDADGGALHPAGHPGQGLLLLGRCGLLRDADRLVPQIRPDVGGL